MLIPLLQPAISAIVGASALIVTRDVAASGSQQIDENTVTPGVIGFFAIFFVAAATVLLVLDMTKRVRRTRYRGEIREQLDAEQAQAAADAALVNRATPDKPDLAKD